MKEKKLEQLLFQYEPPCINSSKKEETIYIATNKYLSLRHKHRLSVIQLIYMNISYFSSGYWLTVFLCFAAIAAARWQLSISTDLRYAVCFSSVGVATMAVLGFPELFKSLSHGMWELEGACVFDLKQIVAAKLVIMSSINILLFSISAVALGSALDTPTINMFLYILLPFNLASLSFIYITRKFHCRWLSYVLFFFVICLISLLQQSALGVTLYVGSMLLLWIVICVITSTLLILYVYNFVSNFKEEAFHLWNLSSIE